ncbi:hypothetical protein Tco_1063051 [Tanacetum coccineum]
MCIFLKDYLKAQGRIQHTSNLEGDCLEVEEKLLEVEAELGYTISLSDEEIALDEQARGKECGGRCEDGGKYVSGVIWKKLGISSLKMWRSLNGYLLMSCKFYLDQNHWYNLIDHLVSFHSRLKVVMEEAPSKRKKNEVKSKSSLVEEANPQDHVKSITTQSDSSQGEASKRVNILVVDYKVPLRTGSFTLLFIIGNLSFSNVLAELEASVSLRPFPTYAKLSLCELALTCLSIKLADKLVKRPRGIVKNILVKIDKFVFPVDFVIIDMPEDTKAPITLGSPFLATARAKIDVFSQRISLKIGVDKIVFDCDKSVDFTFASICCIKIVDAPVCDCMQDDKRRNLTFSKSLDLFTNEISRSRYWEELLANVNERDELLARKPVLTPRDQHVRR